MPAEPSPIGRPLAATALGGAEAEPTYVVTAGELSLSGLDLADFLAAVVDHRRSFRFTARGFSMHPFIRDGDLLTVAPPLDAVRTGQVVAFRDSRSERLIVHRAVLAWEGGCVARGDNAVAPDSVVAAHGILGVVVAVEREGRRVRLGMGPERELVAALSERGLLMPLIAWVRRAHRAARVRVRIRGRDD